MSFVHAFVFFFVLSGNLLHFQFKAKVIPRRVALNWCSDLACSGFKLQLDCFMQRQAMMAFIHLADNLSPTELRWYKDAILDAVTRSIIGCEDLWPVVVQMSVALVTRIEGKNSHSQWYELNPSLFVEATRGTIDASCKIVSIHECG
jgi:hypothetical protein